MVVCERDRWNNIYGPNSAHVVTLYDQEALLMPFCISFHFIYNYTLLFFYCPHKAQTRNKISYTSINYQECTHTSNYFTIINTVLPSLLLLFIHPLLLFFLPFLPFTLPCSLIKSKGVNRQICTLSIKCIIH